MFKVVYKKFYDGFKLMLLMIDFLEEGVILIVKVVLLYDYSSDVKGNGYRSLLRFVE